MSTGAHTHTYVWCLACIDVLSVGSIKVNHYRYNYNYIEVSAERASDRTHAECYGNIIFCLRAQTRSTTASIREFPIVQASCMLIHIKFLEYSASFILYEHDSKIALQENYIFVKYVLFSR